MEVLNVSTGAQQALEAEEMWCASYSTAEEQQNSVRVWGAVTGTASSAVLKEADLV